MLPPLIDLSVLVIEDNDFTRNLIVSILRKIGIGTVREAATVRKAFTILSMTPVSLVLCDLEMEPIGGLAFLQRLRAGRLPEGITPTHPLDPTIPVIVLTVHTSAEVVKRARDAGASDFLSKPVNPKLLQKRIEAVLSESNRSEEDNLYRVIYCSNLSPGIVKDDIKAILARSQVKNIERGITGALCFNVTFFLQLLEGPQKAVASLYAQIMTDARHCNIKTIIQDRIDQRVSKGWSMLFLGADTSMTDLCRCHVGGSRFTPHSMEPAQALSFLVEVGERFGA